MKSTTETLSPTRVKLTIEVPFDEFQPTLKEAYRTIGAQVTVPGFRKGKVPPAVVDQRIGRGAVLDEAINQALPGWYGEALQQSEVEPLGQPEIDLTRFEDGEPIEITAELDVRPEITLPDTSAIAVTVENAEVTDADVHEQLDALREQFATQSDVERPAADGDAVTITLVAKDEDGNVIDGGEATGLPYTVGSGGMLDGLDEAITGLSAGESTSFDTELVGGELKGQAVTVDLTVSDVKERELPELDDDFAATTGGDFDTLDELKADIRERLVRGKRMEQAAEARDLVLDEIIGQVEAPIPDTLAAEELTNRRQQITEQLAMAGMTMEAYLDDEGQTAEEFEADLERRVRDSIVAQFVLDQVVKAEGIEVQDAELSQHIIQRAQQSGQDPNSYIQHIMEHNHVPEMMGEVLRGKALASLVEAATVTDKDGTEIDLSALRGDGSIASEDEPADD